MPDFLAAVTERTRCESDGLWYSCASKSWCAHKRPCGSNSALLNCACIAPTSHDGHSRARGRRIELGKREAALRPLLKARAELARAEARLDAVAETTFCDEGGDQVGEWRQHPLAPIECGPRDGPKPPACVSERPASCARATHDHNCMRSDPESYSRVQQSLSWKWSPAGCHYKPFDRDRMIKWLDAGHRLIYVGDSLNKKMYEGMGHLLQSPEGEPARPPVDTHPKYPNLRLWRENHVGCQPDLWIYSSLTMVWYIRGPDCAPTSPHLPRRGPMHLQACSAMTCRMQTMCLS